MGMWLRSAVKPACISWATARAAARASRSSGQRPASGNSSLAYSMIARVSQTVRSPCSRTGTRPDGETAAMASFQFSPQSRSSRSSKGIPAWRSASQGRSDQDE